MPNPPPRPHIPTDTVPIADLTPHPDNPRQGDIGAIATSIETNGWYGTVVAQFSTKRILAGNHRVEAARHLGITEVPVSWVDVDDATARRILLADNRTNDLATYDDDILTGLLTILAEDDDLLGTGWDGDDLDDLLGTTIKDVITPDLPAVPVTTLGDLVIMGDHRLVCGDSFDPAVLDLAMGGHPVGCVLTDPPYGIDLETDYTKAFGQKGSRTYKPIHADDRPFDAGPFLEKFDGVKEQFWFGADYYRRTIPAPDLSGSWLVWDKRIRPGQERMFGSCFELIWSRTRHKRDIIRYEWVGFRSSNTGQGRIGGAVPGREGAERVHAAEKPIDVLAEILTRWAPAGCRVADPFAGSGTTLIAAEQTGRSCSVVEIDPGYCDVIVARWEQMTGQTAERP